MELSFGKHYMNNILSVRVRGGVPSYGWHCRAWLCGLTTNQWKIDVLDTKHLGKMFAPKMGHGSIPLSSSRFQARR